MSKYPAYVQKMLAQAREMGQYYCGQPDDAALCYDVLALFPDQREASALVYELFCDEWLIYDNRNAIQQHIDEWDDRPWQQRRRLALSFRFLSRWDGWEREYEEGHEHELEGPPDVHELLHEGKMQLLHAYCLGEDECINYAWPHFDEAFRQTDDWYDAMLWVGKQCADLGFFADVAEVLVDLCSQFDDASARRLLAEVRWWRDNAHRLPWLPPPGDGSRYKRMMSFIDPTAPSDDEVIRALRAESPARGEQPLRRKPIIDSDLTSQVTEAMSAISDPPAPQPPLVDWSFLARDDGQPGELPEWAKKMMRLFRGEMAEDIARRHRWSRPIKPPSTPPRRDPNDLPIDRDESDDFDEFDELDESYDLDEMF